MDQVKINPHNPYIHYALNLPVGQKWSKGDDKIYASIGP